MSWAEKFPNPGPEPPTPVEESLLARREFNEWVHAARKHVVACALDELGPDELLTPEKRIARVLGIAYLDNGLHQERPFGWLG